MLYQLRDRLLFLANEWRAEAYLDDRFSGAHEAAEQLGVCAGELETVLLNYIAEQRPLLTGEYAILHRVSRRTVLRRVKDGSLEGYKDNRGHWHIVRVKKVQE